MIWLDSHSILARWRNHLCWLLNVHGVNDVRNTEIHTAETLVSEQGAFQDELVIEKRESHKSPGIDQIPAELIKAGGRTIRHEIHKLIISTWNKEELHEEWKESIIVYIYKKGDKKECSNYRGTSLLPTTFKTLPIILLSRLTPYAEDINVVHKCGFRRNMSTDHIFCIRQILEKKNGKTKQCMSSLQTSRKPMIQSEGRSCIIFSLSLVPP